MNKQASTLYAMHATKMEGKAYLTPFEKNAAIPYQVYYCAKSIIYTQKGIVWKMEQ